MTVLESGFRYDGKEWRSLSALAMHITGYKAINGVGWFGLTEPKAAPAPKAEKAPPAKGKRKPAAPKDAVSDTAAETATT